MAKGRFLKRTAGKARDAEAKAAEAIKAAPDLSPNPMTNLILADVALRSGGQLLRHAVERGLLGAKYSPGKARNIVKGRTMVQTLLGTAAARMATRSVPGALIVGGGLLAKALFDRRRGKAAAKAEGEAMVDRQAERGGE